MLVQGKETKNLPNRKEWDTMKKKKPAQQEKPKKGLGFDYWMNDLKAQQKDKQKDEVTNTQKQPEKNINEDMLGASKWTTKKICNYFNGEYPFELLQRYRETYKRVAHRYTVFKSRYDFLPPKSFIKELHYFLSEHPTAEEIEAEIERMESITTKVIKEICNNGQT